MIDFSNLHSLSADELLEHGFRKYAEKQDGQILYLIPEEYYDYIPEGLMLIDIFGEEIEFLPGETDRDTRFGLLAYGVLR